MARKTPISANEATRPRACSGRPSLLGQPLSRLLMIVGLLWLWPGAAASQDAPPRATAVVTPAVAPSLLGTAAVEAAGVTEVLVLLRSRATLPSLPATADKATRGAAVARALRDHAAQAQAPLRLWLDARGVRYRAFYIVNALVVEADRALLAQLATRPEIAAITSNPAIAMLAPPLPSGPSARSPAATAEAWGVGHIGAPEVWARGYRGEGIVIAGQDTGYDWNHPALKTQYRGWNGSAVDHDYNWHDAIHTPGGLCRPDSPEPCDDHGHGTHTMGTMVGQAQTQGATPIGVAPGATWIGCRNMHRGVGTPASYTECFEFFLAPYPVGGSPTEGDPRRAPDVINNSWSCPVYEGCDAIHIGLLEQVVANVRAAGIMVVASAGNEGAWGCNSVNAPPGMYDAATSVGATDLGDVIAYFSSRGSAAGLQKPDLTAPGTSILSSLPDGRYETMSGTSMAAPHVAGAAALVWSARPDLRGQITATERLLLTTAVPRTSDQCGDGPDAVPNSVYGWGRLDAAAAVQAALSLPIMPYRFYLPLLIGEADAVHSWP